MSNIKIPTHLVPSFIERMRWETKRRAALIDLANKRLDSRIHWSGLLEHYNLLFHEDLSKDVVFRRYFDELKSLSAQSELNGKKFIDVSLDMYNEIKRLVGDK